MAWKLIKAEALRPLSQFAVETYPLESIEAAEKMARKRGGNFQERSAYAKTLVREGQALGAYITQKNSTSVGKGKKG